MAGGPGRHAQRRRAFVPWSLGPFHRHEKKLVTPHTCHRDLDNLLLALGAIVQIGLAPVNPAARSTCWC